VRAYFASGVALLDDQDCGSQYKLMFIMWLEGARSGGFWPATSKSRATDYEVAAARPVDRYGLNQTYHAGHVSVQPVPDRVV